MKPGALAGLLILAALPSLSLADGLRLEGGLVKSEQSNSGDNIWYDADGYAHRNMLHPWGGEIGLSDDVNSWLGWRASAVYFGKSTSSAVFPDDSDYFARDGAPAKYEAKGWGTAYGVTLAPTLNYRPWEDVEISAEAGMLLYRAKWNEEVRPIGGTWFDAAQVLAPDMAAWHTDYAPYAGLTVRVGDLYAAYRKYRDVYAVDSVFGNSVKQIVVGLSIPIE